MIDTVIFDAEGVVIDTELLWDRGTEEFFRRRGVAYERGRLKHLLTGRSLVDGVRVMQRLYGFPGTPEELAAERTEIVKGLLDGRVSLIEGFREFFSVVRSSHKTCIATAMRDELFAAVDRQLGLTGLFGGRIYTVEGVGCRSKPEPDLFLYAARELGSSPERCLVIEDAPLGIDAARQAGMRCVALTTTYGRDTLAAAHRVVDSFAEIDLTRWS